MIQQTSLTAFIVFQDHFNRQESEIIECLGASGPGLSYWQISELTGIKINAVCGRMNDLRKKGVIVADGFIVNPHTRVTNKTWRLSKMVSTQEALESQFLNADLVKTSATKKLVVVREGEYQETKFGKKLILTVNIDGKEKQWRPNKDSIKNLNIAFGSDTVTWIGKTAKLSIVSMQGKESVVAIAEGA